MDNKIIIGLIVIIILASIILGLKITGIIKPKKSSYDSFQNTSVEIDSIEISEGTYTELLNTFKKSSNKLISTSVFFSIIIQILTTALAFVCLVGESKLYLKLSMPVWTSRFIIITFLAQIVLLYCSSSINIIFQIIIGIIAFFIMYYFLEAVNLSGYLIFFTLIPIVGLIILLLLHILSSMRLSAKFNKGFLFTLGLIFLPVIFQAILGYRKEELLL